MAQHTITNVGPTSIKVIFSDGWEKVLDPGNALTCEIQRIEHPPEGRVEYTVQPGSFENDIRIRARLAQAQNR